MWKKLVVVRKRRFFRLIEKAGRSLHRGDIRLFQTRLQEVSDLKFGGRCKF
jgi:hypothetical protein